MNGKEIEFSGGFKDLHTVSYENILKNNGFEVSVAKTAIKIVSDLREMKLDLLDKNLCHSFIL